MQPLGIPTLTRGAPRALTREVWTWIEARRVVPYLTACDLGFCNSKTPTTRQIRNHVHTSQASWTRTANSGRGEDGTAIGSPRHAKRTPSRGLIRNAPSRPHLREFATWGFAAQNGRLLGRSRISPLLSEFFKPEGHLPPSYTSTSPSFAASREESNSASQARSVS